MAGMYQHYKVSEILIEALKSSSLGLLEYNMIAQSKVGNYLEYMDSDK
jgi:hypothetical protein